MTRTYRWIEQVVAWSLVAAQLLLLAAIVLLPGPRWWSTPGWLDALAAVTIVLAAALALAGAVRLGTGFSASPLPAATARLRTSGVYACVRHPIYAGLLVGGFGAALLRARLTSVIAWVGLLGVLLVKARLEERKLAARFSDYRSYAERTPRFLPNPARCTAPWRGRSRANRR